MKTMKASKNVASVVTAGRSGASAYFERSGIRFGDTLNHTPFLVFNEKDSEVVVEVVDSAKKLIKYPARTKVMAQWAGKKRSDFIQFTVGELKQYVRNNPPHTCQVI